VPVPHTPSQLRHAWESLGISPGQTIMLHASVKAVGAVMGGPNTILQTLLHTLTPAGTLMMYAGWQDAPDFVLELPPDERALYYAEHPPFDPATARAVRDNSVLTEFLRTWPGSQRSLNPEASMVAVGAQAAWITANHPLNYGYGPGSPLDKLLQLQGQVVLLGSPLDTTTLLHYAENVAHLRHKNVVHYAIPILREGRTTWVEVEDYDTGEAHGDYSFEQIVQAYLDSGKGYQSIVGNTTTYRLDAADLVQFAVAWLEARY
jgi:aminoglycoside 3-N-acetyltransferase